ncbi:MAG: ParB N-terminal domain-containing protein [Verrucomicrobiota bacterium]
MKTEIQLIPINQIRVINPRYRDKKKFELIVQNIKSLGLKKPIQISKRSASESTEPGYDLVCGQGRMEAFAALGYEEIPAIIVDVCKEDRLLRSLIENMARKFPSPLALIHEIERLKKAGHSNVAIGNKLDISDTVVGGLLALNQAGEERLMEATIAGRISVPLAMEIAKVNSVESQRELLNAYEKKQLNGGSIRAIKKLMNHRQLFGKKRGPSITSAKSQTTAETLVRAYKKESSRQRALVRKAKICEARLLFVETAFKKMLADGHFATLLRAEKLESMPKVLTDRI